MLELILGPDWTANRRWIFERVKKEVENKCSGTVLIVPEMISHDTERILCREAGDTASRYAEVLPFSRLENRVAESCGMRSPQVLDGGGRVVAMASAARSLHSRVKVFAGLDTKAEFLQQLLDMVDELKQCRIGPEELMDASLQTQGAFAQKLADLSLLMESYNATCSQGKKDPGDRMDFLIDRLQTSDYGSTHRFFVDGFPDFTRQHMAVLQQLISDSPLVMVSLCCGEAGASEIGWEKAGQTAQELIAFAKRAGIPFVVRNVPPGDTPLSSLAIHALQKSGPVDMEYLECVSAWEADSLWQECSHVMDRITELVMSGCRYRDIAIACGDLTSYQPTLALLAMEYGIPLYIAGKEDILQNPMIATVLSALDAAAGDRTREEVLRYLKSPLSPVGQEMADRLENYAVIWGISGKKWSEAWENHPVGLGEPWDEAAQRSLQELNDARQAAIAPLDRLQAGMKNAECVGQQVSALIAFLEEIHFSDLLETAADRMESLGQHRSAQILNQLWEILLGALEQMQDVLGQTYWEGEDFSRLLALLLSQYDVGTIPAVLDSVTAGSVSAIRCETPKHLFLLGAQEGVLPSYSGSAGILTNHERLELRRIGVQISGASADKLQSEFADLYCLLCGARETVCVSSSGGQSAAVLLRLGELSGGVQKMRESNGPIMRDPRYAAACLASFGQEDWARKLGLADDYEKATIRSDYSPGSLTARSVRDLYGEKLRLSASQIDRAATCKMAYFLEYGLRIRQRKEITVDPTQFGTYVHAVLEHTGKTVMQQGGFRNVSLEQTLAIAEAFSARYVQENFSQLDSGRVSYLLSRNRQELMQVVEEMWNELSESRFDPVGFEVNFDDGQQMAPIEIHGKTMDGIVRGYVDRVDVYEKDGTHYFRVVDYKTGEKKFDYCDIENGVGLQMLLYLFALKHSGQSLVGSSAVTAGVMYFPARIPVLSENEKPTDEEILRERKKKMVRSGLYLADEDVLSAMESGEKPQRFDFGYDKAGNLKGSLADRSQWKMLESFVDQILSGLLDTISEGCIEADPYTRGEDHNPCSYCPYGGICHSATVPGRRNLAAVKDTRFWEDVKKEVEGNGRSVF